MCSVSLPLGEEPVLAVGKSYILLTVTSFISARLVNVCCGLGVPCIERENAAKYSYCAVGPIHNAHSDVFRVESQSRCLSALKSEI